MAFGSSHRYVHVGRDLFVGAAGRGLHGGIKLAGGEQRSGGNGLRGGGDGALAAGQESRRVVLGGPGFARLAGASPDDGGFGAGFGGVEVRAEVFKIVGDLVEIGAVLCRQGTRIAGTGADQVAVDFIGQGSESGLHLLGPAEAGQAVQGARGADQVADLFAEVGGGFQLGAGRGKVPGRRGRPRPGGEQVGLVDENLWQGKGVQRCECLGGPVGLSGQCQRLGGGDVEPAGRGGASELPE